MPHVENVNLTGHFLIAMPAMANPYFAKSLTLICEHNDDGAMGVVVNRPTDMQLDALFEQAQLKLRDTVLASATVHFGGPVQLERGFVLHQPVGAWKSTLAIDEDTALTTSLDILEAVADGNADAFFAEIEGEHGAVGTPLLAYGPVIVDGGVGGGHGMQGLKHARPLLTAGSN